MKRLMILGFVASLALLGCQTTDKMMDDDMDDDMESGQMEESMDEDESMDKDDSMDDDSM